MEIVSQRGQTKRAEVMFGKLAVEWLEIQEPGWSKSHRSNVRHLLLNHASSLSNRPVQHITTDEVATVVKAAPAQGERLRAAISAVLEFAKKEHLVQTNLADRELLSHKFGEQRRNGPPKHHKSKPYNEVPALFQRLRTIQSHTTGVAAFCLEFLILVGCRAGEVIGMVWSEVDLERRIWTIPVARLKRSEYDHRVPLCDRAVELLQIARKRSDGSGNSNERVWAVSVNGVYDYLRDTLNEPFTLHGFRSSFRNFAAEMTPFDGLVAEYCLAHKLKDKTEADYLTAGMMAKRGALMAAWGEYCITGVNPRPWDKEPEGTTFNNVTLNNVRMKNTTTDCGEF